MPVRWLSPHPHDRDFFLCGISATQKDQSFILRVRKYELRVAEPFILCRTLVPIMTAAYCFTGSIRVLSPALSSGFPNLILCCFYTTITPDDLSPRVSHPRDLILLSFSARKYRCFSVLPLTKSILIFPQPQLRRFRSLSNLSIPTFHQFQPVVISIILACFLLAYNTSLHYRCSFYG